MRKNVTEFLSTNCTRRTIDHSLPTLVYSLLYANMSFFGIGRPQPTSAEKIAAVEAEMKMMADMHNR